MKLGLRVSLVFDFIRFFEFPTYSVSNLRVACVSVDEKDTLWLRGNDETCICPPAQVVSSLLPLPSPRIASVCKTCSGPMWSLQVPASACKTPVDYLSRHHVHHQSPADFAFARESLICESKTVRLTCP
jgi:hypothetical protein